MVTSSLRKQIYDQFRDYKYWTYHFKFHNIYRGRKFHNNGDCKKIQGEIKHIRHMWCPPRSKAKKQRCNLKGQPLLYLSASISSIPFELRCKRGDYVSIVEYNSRIDLSPIVIIGWENLMAIEHIHIRKIIKDHFINSTTQIKEMDKKLSELFVVKKEELDSDVVYDNSIAITSNFFKKGNIGLIYPSIESESTSFNLVLKPQYAKTTLRPRQIFIYEILELYSVNRISVLPKSKGEIQKNGNIKWIDLFDSERLIIEK